MKFLFFFYNFTGSCDNVTHLTKNEIGKLLIKLCFESSQSDTLSYDELFKQLQTQMIEIKDKNIRNFKDIAGCTLGEFLMHNKDTFTFIKKKGKRSVKLKASSKQKSPSSDCLKHEAEKNQKNNFWPQKDAFKEMLMMIVISGPRL